MIRFQTLNLIPETLFYKDRGKMYLPDPIHLQWEWSYHDLHYDFY